MKYKNTIIAVILSLLFTAGITYGASLIYPYQGGSGQDTSGWTGYTYITSGVWGTSTPAGGGDYTVATDSYLYNTGDTATGNYTFGTSTLFIDNTNERIGIGTTTPSEALHIHGIGKIRIGDQATNPGGKLRVTMDDSDSETQGIKVISMRTSGTNYGYNGTAAGIGAVKNIGLYSWAEGATTNLGLWVDKGDTLLDDALTVSGTSTLATTTITTLTLTNDLDLSDDVNLAVSGTLLDLTNDTLSINEGTLTDTKYCIYTAGTGIVCNSTPTGSGDVTAVGNCATGDCFDGTSDGGTYLNFYDADGIGQLITGNISTTTTWTLPAVSGTLIYSGGAFHDGFSDYVANEHLDWTTNVGTIDVGNYVENYTHTGDVTGATALTIAVDAVHDTMIDWGTGASQVALEDIPSGFTTGSVLFATTSGYLVEDNDNFFYSSDNGGQLAIGSNTGMNNVFQAVKAESTTDVTTVKALIAARNTNTTNNNWAGLTWQTLDMAGDIFSGARIMTQFTSHATTSVSANMSFDTRNAGSRSVKMIIMADGKVGIGTTTPSQLLTVGNANQFTVTSAGAVDATSLTLDTALAVAEGGTGATSLNDLITLTTHTTGNYAAGDGEAGNALTGDAAVDFFGAGVDAVTDATTCTNIEGTGLAITTGTLNWSSSGLTWAGNALTNDYIASSTEFLADNDTTYTEEEIQDLAFTNIFGGTETLISVAYDDVGNDIDFVVDNNLHNYSWANVVDADITNTLTVDGYMQDGDINTFSELQAWVSDETLAKLATTTDAKYCTWDATGGDIVCNSEGGSGYTNLTSFVDQTAWRVFYSNTAGDVTELALGADGTYLKSNGAAAAPTWGSPAGSGDVEAVGNCASGLCFDGSSDGGTNITFYNIDSNKTQLIASDTASDLIVTLPTTSMTIKDWEISSGTIHAGNYVENVSTALSVGTVGVNTVAITSDGGADDVTLPAATVSAAGMLTTAKWGEIVANNAKNTNVSTTLSAGTINATTYAITSDGGADDIILPEADTTNAGLLGADKWDEIVANSLHSADNTQAHSDYFLNSGSDIAGGGTGFTWGFNASAGSDPVMTFGDGVINITTGALQVGGAAVQTGADLVDDAVASCANVNACTLTADAITDNLILLADFAHSQDYGDFTIGAGESFTLDTGVVGDNEIDYSEVTLADFDYQGNYKTFYTDGSGDVQELAIGASTYVLTSAGTSSAPTWSAAGGGDVTKVGTPANSQIGVWTGDGTIEGAASLTYDGANLQLTGDIGSTGTKITKGWFTDLTVTNAIAGSITGSAPTLTTARDIGGVSFDGSAAIVPTTIVVADTTDATSFVGLWTDATGNLLPKTDAGLTYNATTGMLTATGFTGPLTGEAATVATIAGLAPNTATTQATQGNITSLGTLTGLTMGGDIAMGGYDIDNGGVIFLTEQADADADVAGKGQIWVNTATPNELWFTDDAGTDTQLGVAGATPTTITVADESADTTSFIGFFTAATGDLGPKTAAGLTFNASTDILTATGFAGPLTGNVTGDCSGSAGTVATIDGLAPNTATTQAAQGNITSLGTLTALQIDNININLNTISSTAGTDLLITPLGGQQIILDGTIIIDAGVVTGATSITSTAFVGALTGNADTVTTNANLTGIVTSTGNATAIANKAIAIAKLADGTDGELITWDTNGVITTVPVGTATHVLTSNGVGVAPTFQAPAAGGGDVTDVFDCSTGDCNTLTVGTSEWLIYGTGFIDANRFAGVTTVDGTEFGYLNGVTSAIQTQFDAKQPLEATLTDIADGTIAENLVNTANPWADNEVASNLTINSTALITSGVGFDGIGAVDLDYGSVDITDHTFITDGTGTAEIVLPAGSIDGTEILDDTIDSADYAAVSIDAEHIAADTITHAQIADSDQTDTKCIYFEDPTADDDFKSIWTANGFAATITKIWCESDQTVNMDLQTDDGTPSDVNGADLVCDSTPAEDESMGGDATLADGNRLDLAITSVSGTPTWVSICWTFQYDD